MSHELFGNIITKGARCIIVNGQLLRHNGSLVFADASEKRSDKLDYFLYGNKRARTQLGSDGLGEKLIYDEIQKFVDEYAPLMQQVEEGQENPDLQLTASRDDFIGAYIISVGLYWKLADARVHDKVYQYPAGEQELRDAFVLRELINYFDVFTHRISNRLMSQSMPIKVKAHLIGGLFQPCIATTNAIVCPLQWKRFSWFMRPLESAMIELEGTTSSHRGLELVVIPMNQLCATIGSKLQTEVNRRYFMCILCAACAMSVTADGAAKFMQRYPEYYAELTSKRSLSELLLAALNYADIRSSAAG